MKNSITKALTLVISLALLVCGIFAISASADNEASANIELATLNYGGEVRIVYALSLSGTTAENVVLKIYDNPSLTGTPYVSTFSGEYYEGNSPIFYSKGISAKDLADYIWAVPCDKASGEALGRACRYSVAHYCNATLADANAAEDLKILAEDLLTYGASAQRRLINIGNIASEPLVTDYNYVYTKIGGVKLDGYSSGLYAPGTKVTPTYNGDKTVSAWIVTNADGTSFSVSASDAANGIAVTQNAVIAPEFVASKIVADFSEGFVQDAPVTNTKGQEDNYAIIANDATSHAGTEIVFEIADPLGGTNNALKVTSTNAYLKQPGYTKIAVSGEGNCSVFETDIYAASQNKGEFNRIVFLDTEGKNIARFMLYCQEDGNCKIMDYNGASSVTLGTFDINKWVTLKIEYYKSSVAGESYYKIFVDGVLLIQAGGAYTVTDNPISEVRFNHQRTLSYVAYYDNISAFAENKAYTPEFKTVDFENGGLTAPLYETKDNNILITSGTEAYEGSVANYSITTDPTNAANKVLKATTFGTSATLANGLTSYKVQKMDALNGNNCTVFESRMYIATPTATNECIYIYFTNSKGTVTYINFAASTAGTVTVKSIMKTDSGSKGTTLATFDTDKWINIRIEVYKSTILEENYIKMYLGDDSENMMLVASVAGYNNATNATDTNPITSVRVDYFRKSALDMYFDDVCVYDQNKAYVKE